MPQLKKRGHIACLCRNEKSDQKHTQEKHETKMKPWKQFKKEKKFIKWELMLLAVKGSPHQIQTLN